MRKTTKLFLGFTAGLLLLCGCSAAEEKLGYENADVAKEALASASSVRMRCDLDNVDASGNIYADEKAAAYMKNSGLFDQTWTISISGEEWFHMKIVTDEEINKMTKSATTYAFYDPDNNLTRVREAAGFCMMKMTRRSAAERSGDPGSVFLTSGTRIFTVPSLRPRRTARGRLISWTGWRCCGVWSAITAQLTTILSTPACRFMKRLPLFLC